MSTCKLILISTICYIIFVQPVRIGYYEQTGLNLTADQENMPVLKFVQEAVDIGRAEIQVGTHLYHTVS